MAKGKTAVQGIYFEFRPAKGYDALRVWVRPSDGDQIAISSKLHPTLKEICKHLKANGLNHSTALEDRQFQILWHRLQQELQSKHGLKAYKALVRVDLHTKEFNFEDSFDDFEKYKGNTSVSHAYRSTLEHFWLPFFLGLGCTHPSQFKEFRVKAETHVRTAMTIHDEPYSFHSYGGLCKALNQYMKFLEKYKVINSDNLFTIWIVATLEEKKRGKLKRKRSTSTYDRDEVIEIKECIDETYADDLEKKLIAYGIYFGPCTGLRQANLLGLKAKDLFPDHKVPHFRVSDSIVRGWSRGLKGYIKFENATKTTSQEDGEILLPLLQPSIEIVCEVARFLKKHYKSDERILPLSPNSVYRAWERIARECGFRFLNPHNWKHSYATIGGEHLEQWYKGDLRLLQLCCLHKSLTMTEKYIKKKYAKSLQAWASRS